MKYFVGLALGMTAVAAIAATWAGSFSHGNSSWLMNSSLASEPVWDSISNNQFNIAGIPGSDARTLYFEANQDLQGLLKYFKISSPSVSGFSLSYLPGQADRADFQFSVSEYFFYKIMVRGEVIRLESNCAAGFDPKGYDYHTDFSKSDAAVMGIYSAAQLGTCIEPSPEGITVHVDFRALRGNSYTESSGQSARSTLGAQVQSMVLAFQSRVDELKKQKP